MSILSKLFGGSKEPEPQPGEPYKGFTITPVPMKDGGEYRLSALIEYEGKSHRLIRADNFPSLDQANAAAIAKAKTLIDQMGTGLF
ncbi:MAG: HlyU family transcriptional regulator [Rubricella sp.]